MKQLLCLLILLSAATLLAQPANDNPCGAIELPLFDGASCVPDQALSWQDATATPGFSQPFCGSYSTGDVWFKFTLDTASNIFITTLAGNGAGAITDGAMELYYGASCSGPLFLLQCNDDSGPGSMPQISLAAQAPGAYYIRFWDYADKNSGVIGGICVATQAVPLNTANDEPCGAIPLTVSTADSCTPSQPYSWLFASASGSVAPPGCGGYATGDVWFSFVLDDTSDVAINTLPGAGPDGITDGAMALYSGGNCAGALTLLICNNDVGVQAMPFIHAIAVLPGQYYIRFWDVSDRTSANFGGICVAAQPASAQPVANDEPCSAIPLLVNAGASCTPDMPVNWANATASAGFASPGCGSYSTGDVWFSFELDEASDVLIRTAAGVITDGAMLLYTADSCSGTFTQIICDDDSGPGSMPQIQLNALPAGLYFIRFWDYQDKVSGSIGGICVAAVPTVSQVPNDNCITALPFPAIPADGSCAEVNVNTIGATGSPTTNCGAIGDDDVWYSFTVPPGVAQLAFECSVNGNPVEQGVRIYAGSCDPLTSLACFVESQGIIPNLTPGATYLLKTCTPDDDDGAQYRICLRAVLPPVNDEPCGAILLPVQDGPDCSFSGPLSWETASATPGLPAPGCGDYSTGDVWFKFELTYKADVLIRTAAGTGPNGITDGAMALYYATDCSNLVQLACTDDLSPSDLMPQLPYFALPPGVYYLRFWDYLDKISGNIGGICVAAVPSVSTAGNEHCFQAEAFPDIPADGSCATVLVNTAGATGNQSPPLPGFQDQQAPWHADDDLWYSFVVPANTTRLLYETEVLGGNSQLVLYFYDECGYNLPFYEDTEEGEGLLKDLVPGQTCFARVFTKDQGVNAQFNFCLKLPPPPPANDNCSNAQPFPVIPVNGNCATVSVDARWATSAGNDNCGINPQDDVWFSFVVPANVTDLKVDLISSPESAGQEAFELIGGSCASQVALGCFSQNTPLIFNNLIPGDTYFIRAFTNSTFAQPVFDICLRTLPPPPPNDLCANAIPFPAIPTDGSCATVIADTKNATGDYDNDCYGTVDDDVWFSFVAPPNVNTLLIQWANVSGSPYEVVGIYSGDCNNLVLHSCHIDGVNVIPDLTPGATYYLKAYSWDPNDVTSFEICLSVAPPPPANDECPGATTFPSLPENGAWVTLGGTTLGAGGQNALACNGWADDDVWYSFVLPAGHDRVVFNIDVDNAVNDYGLIMELYQGDCGNLEFLGCYNDGDGHIDSLTPGALYYLRLYTQEQFEFASFDLGLKLPLPAVNDLCEQALVFPPLPEDGSCVSLSANTALATGNYADGLNCYGYEDDDVWFSFVVPADRTAVITDLWRHFGDGVQMQVFGGTCDNLIPIECFFIAESVEDISGLEPGHKYWLRVYSRGLGTSSDFEICMSAAPAPPPNDNCDQAVSITPTPGVFADPGPQTTAGATGSGEPLCPPYDAPWADGIARPYDVWYRFTTDSDGGNATLTIDYEDVNSATYLFYNLGVQVFEGSCGSLNSIWCNPVDIDNNTLTLSGLEGNTTYFFRVFPLTGSGNYAPVGFTIFAEGTGLSPVSAAQDDDELSGKISVFPSPASTQITVQIGSRAEGDVRLLLLDATGRMADSRQIHLQPGDNRIPWAVADLPAGLYAVWVESAQGRCAMARWVKE
ncbi:MAG TPA: hypothetical protein PKH43_00245 [Saprospiraceae bacterium]|nr:hypothetical protein [Saprospiraceae bacterium]